MSQLLAMSFDVAASPSIWLRELVASDPSAASAASAAGAGWGFAWYPGNAWAASVIRDPRPVSDNGLTEVLRDWDRFRASTFLCHIRGAAKRPGEQDTHPFARAYAGRDFTFAHNGQLDQAAARGLWEQYDNVYEPVGTTDSEQAFCWLLNRMRASGARSFADVGYDVLRQWLGELNALGTLNAVLSDGQDLVVYSDASGFRPLHFVRRVPPHAQTRLENAVVTLDHSDPLDVNRTLLLVATTPMGDDWTCVGPGHMLVARRGAISYHSLPAGERQPAPVPAASSSPASTTRIVARAPEIVFGSTQDQHASNGTSPAASLQADPNRRRYRILHETAYSYKSEVARSTHALRLRPVHDVYQTVLEHSLEISVDCERRDFEDVFGNMTTRAWIGHPYSDLRVTARSIVEVTTVPTPVPRKATTLPLVWMPWQRQMMTPYLLPPELPETQLRELSGFAMSFAERQDYDVAETMRDLNMTIRRDFGYVQGVTSVQTTPFEVYVSREGVCQDFANLFICLARLLGVPARYRVGYIHTGGAYDNELQSDASHAWVEVYLPWAGWRGFDPTNGCPANLDHISVATGRNYRDATPTTGTLYKGGGDEALTVRVEVELIDEAGNRITKT